MTTKYLLHYLTPTLALNYACLQTSTQSLSERRTGYLHFHLVPLVSWASQLSTAVSSGLIYIKSLLR